MIITFQHLDTFVDGFNINYFGRTKDGKSVCCVVKKYEPTMVIKIDDKCDIVERIDLALTIYFQSKKILSKDNVDGMVPIFKNKASEYVCHSEIVSGQDIKAYNENGESLFLKLRLKHFAAYNALKKLLTTEIEYVTKQSITSSDQKYFDYVKKTVAKCNATHKTAFGYMFDRPYDVYNDHVKFGLQYLIENDIYSCSWIQVDGEKYVDRDIRSDITIHVNSMHPVTCNDMAPWRILTYDIEAVPYPKGNGKFEFPKAERDPVCTIGAVLQIDKDIKKHVWIFSPNGDPIETLSPVKDPTDEYTSEDILVHHFDDEEKMIRDFGKFIVDNDIMIQLFIY